MGFIRGSLLVIVTTLFFISLLVGNMLLTLTLSLQYENVKPELVSVIGDVLEKQMGGTDILSENVPMGSEAIIEEEISNMVDDVYYTEYDCDFWDCLGETEIPFFLVSKKAQNYWRGNFYIVLIASFVLILLMFLLIQKKTSLPLLVGGLSIISSLPFIKIGSFIEAFLTPILSSTGTSNDLSFSLMGIFSIFFSKSYTVFLIMLILGVVLLIVGVVLKLFKIGFNISNLFSRFQKEGAKKSKKISKDEVKQIVRKEISNKKKNKKSK